MLYTVREVSNMSGTTIKTLHHYHKIGLLEPAEISETGYRLYGEKELERLQQILFYRELDFSLWGIKEALENEESRLEGLLKQQELINKRRQKMDCMLATIRASIADSVNGEIMDKSIMFKGLNKEEWIEALSEQREYIKDKYEYDLLENKILEAEDMNEKALEAKLFMKSVVDALVNGWKATDERLQKLISDHIKYLSNHGIAMDAELFAKQARFFLEDDFHRNMFESMQTGFAYYLCIAAEEYFNSIV